MSDYVRNRPAMVPTGFVQCLTELFLVPMSPLQRCLPTLPRVVCKNCRVRCCVVVITDVSGSEDGEFRRGGVDRWRGEGSSCRSALTGSSCCPRVWS